jgi:hypothetical protein
LGGVAAVEVAHVETRRFHKRLFHQSHELVKKRFWDIARWVKVFVPQIPNILGRAISDQIR